MDTSPAVRLERRPAPDEGCGLMPAAPIPTCGPVLICGPGGAWLATLDREGGIKGDKRAALAEVLGWPEDHPQRLPLRTALTLAMLLDDLAADRSQNSAELLVSGGASITLQRSAKAANSFAVLRCAAEPGLSLLTAAEAKAQAVQLALDHPSQIFAAVQLLETALVTVQPLPAEILHAQ